MSGLLFAYAPVAQAAFSDSAKNQACQGIKDTTDPNACSPTASNSVSNVISLFLNLFSVIIGIAAVLMIMVGGYKLVTSGGDPNNVASGRNTILWALVGAAVAAMAQIIVHFVLSKATNA